MRYASNFDGGECYALFEGRYVLTHDPGRHVVLAPAAAVATFREAASVLGHVVA